MSRPGRYAQQWSSSQGLCFFRETAHGNAVEVTESSDGEPEKSRPALFCRQCRSLITDEQQRTAVAGKHCHTFPNPEGIVFEIGCFSLAPGCKRQGRATAEFSWFPPHAWSYALCRFCQSHLGWYYEAAGKPSFYGLILDRLVGQSSSGGE